MPAASSTASANGRNPTKALVIVEENHSERAALEQMPYLAGLADEFGRTTAYRAVTHPSLPNYLAVAGGSTFGVSDDQPPSSHPIQQVSVFDAVIAAGGTAKTYAEAISVSQSGRGRRVRQLDPPTKSFFHQSVTLW